MLPPPVSPSLIAPPPREDKLTQDERSYFEMGADILRGLAQPLNYMREISEGNYVPTQAELESEGISAMESVLALANPADHIYAALAAEGMIDDPNYKKEDGMTYGTPGLLGLVGGTAAKKTSDAIEGYLIFLKAPESLLMFSNPQQTFLDGLKTLTGMWLWRLTPLKKGLSLLEGFTTTLKLSRLLEPNTFLGGTQ